MVTHTPELKIRPATSNDARMVADLHLRSLLATYPEVLAPAGDAASVHPGGIDPAAVWETRIQQKQGTVLVAEQAGQIIGVVWCGPSPDHDDGPPETLRIHSLHADPDHLGAGIGRALLEAARRWMRAAGASQASLWVVDSNERARRFYERDGWLPDGTHRRESLALSGDDGPQMRVIRLLRPLTERG